MAEKSIHAMPLFLTNTVSGKKELFVPIQDPNVSLYVCGITPYDYAHIGHGRVYVVFDVLYRLLGFLKYHVTYCRNFTNIDDKIIARAVKELGDPKRYKEISDKYIVSFHDDMHKLGCLPPAHEPLVTDNIDDIIAFIGQLVKNGFAYQADGDVYFSIKKFAEYGNLSKRNLDEMLVGARVSVNEKKHDPRDFVLWKGDKEGPVWQSPWGPGRPGWHIDCSTLATKFLSTHIDIHGGGMDLIFPHHENEIAQSEALSGPLFVKYWLHNAFVRINKEKMSKSLGNFFTLRDVFEQFDPMVVRYLYLQHHYRSPLDFSFEDLEIAQKNYQKIAALFEGVQSTTQLSIPQLHPIIKEMLTLLCDDLNMPGVFGVIFKHYKEFQSDPALKNQLKFFVESILGLELTVITKDIIITPEIERLLAARQDARLKRDWKTADMLRDDLRKLGYEVKDEKSK